VVPGAGSLQSVSGIRFGVLFFRIFFYTLNESVLILIVFGSSFGCQRHSFSFYDQVLPSNPRVGDASEVSSRGERLWRNHKGCSTRSPFLDRQTTPYFVSQHWAAAPATAPSIPHSLRPSSRSRTVACGSSSPRSCLGKGSQRDSSPTECHFTQAPVNQCADRRMEHHPMPL